METDRRKTAPSVALGFGQGLFGTILGAFLGALILANLTGGGLSHTPPRELFRIAVLLALFILLVAGGDIAAGFLVGGEVRRSVRAARFLGAAAAVGLAFVFADEVLRFAGA